MRAADAYLVELPHAECHLQSIVNNQDRFQLVRRPVLHVPRTQELYYDHICKTECQRGHDAVHKWPLVKSKICNISSQTNYNHNFPQALPGKIIMSTIPRLLLNTLS